MKHAGTSAIAVGAERVQRLIYSMLQYRFDYPLCYTKNRRLKCNLLLLLRLPYGSSQMFVHQKNFYVYST